MDGPTSWYVVVRFGDISRGETMNIAVCAWEPKGPDSPVYLAMLQDWQRVRTAFPRPLDLEEDARKRLSTIRTSADLDSYQFTPYTPFAFSERMPSTLPASELLKLAVKVFLVELERTEV